MAAVVLAVTTEFFSQAYLVNLPVPVQVLGQASTVPFPEVYGKQASETSPVSAIYFQALLRYPPSQARSVLSQETKS